MRWVVVGQSNVPSILDENLRLSRIAEHLDREFDASIDAWLALGKELASQAGCGADLAHTPVCAPNVSDFGVMLAWSRLVEQWADRQEDVLIVCDDPWLFRHLALLRGVRAGRAPSVWLREIKLAVRGRISRLLVALRMARASWSLRNQRASYDEQRPAILVYGHPASRPDGHDGYFGSLLNQIGEVQRVLHVDCAPDRARALFAAGRTVSLHAWGNAASSLCLPFVRWRPRISAATRGYAWLIRRAAALEGGSGQAAMIRWQQICQVRWLRDKHPSVVAWAWENHAWERRFVVEARACNVRTAGYQHTPFGRQDFSFHPGSNPQGEDNIPDVIMATGRAYLDIMAAMGYPRDRLNLAGSLRFSSFSPPQYSADGPVLFALPYHLVAAPQMTRAASDLQRQGWKVLVKPHPMMPANIAAVPASILTHTPFADQQPLSAVVFAASSIGLEALAGAIPVIRFLPEGHLALDPLPPGVTVPAADSTNLASLLKEKHVVSCELRDYYGPVDFDIWRRLFTA